ncbi:MAG: T9SS type A sorting domain-containing protein [Calditrichaeota bacterium]|nr:T9SS type A sorting domain-containing protein [Calditrichota bacterium]
MYSKNNLPRFLSLSPLIFLIFISVLQAQTKDTLIFQNWEQGIGNWYADNGVWEVGAPTVGPKTVFSGTECAGTILGGNYPAEANTSLISPPFKLPAVNEGEEIILKFWHWFMLQERNANYPYSYDPDKGFVRLSINNGNWIDIEGYFTGFSSDWTQVVVPLTPYAKNMNEPTVRIAFYFTSSGNNQHNGWYIDDILVLKQEKIFTTEYDFEDGVGDWSAENGLWQVGSATVGPKEAFSGKNVAGTLLGDNYPKYADTRFISPEIQLPEIEPEETLQLKFWQWFVTKERNADYPYSYNPDNGYVQISVAGEDWETIYGPLNGKSPVWSQVNLNISRYASELVRFAFYFTSTSDNNDLGWYIDDFKIEKKIVTFRNPEDFENGIGDWWADNGVWEYGTPDKVGPESAHSGSYFFGTIIDDSYPNYANSRLISPEFTVNVKKGEIPSLYFWHWFKLKERNSNYPYSYDPDEGYVQVSVKGGEWQNMAGPFTGDSPVWTQNYVDLSAYQDSTIRIAFYFTSSSNNQDQGWYIDDIRLVGINIDDVNDNNAFTPTEFKLFQNYPNPFNATTKIQFVMPRAAYATIEVFNILGQKVTTLLNKKLSAGLHHIIFDGKKVPSGVYYYRLKISDRGGNARQLLSQTKKMILMK